MTPLEALLRRLARSLDDRALEALASRGLLRRARRDLERGEEIQVVSEVENALVLRVAGHEVRMPSAGPAATTCSCPAGGVCQHVLAATLFLQATTSGDLPPEPAASADDTRTAVLGISHDELALWSGNSVYRAGVKIADESASEVMSGRQVRVRFPSRNIEVHLATGALLDGAIGGGALAERSAYVVAAVLALQRTGGAPGATQASPAARDEAAGTPRSRSEIIAACQMLLSESLSNGLSRLTPATQQRWTTLAMSALGANLPRLAHLLRSVAAEVTMAESRDAGSDLARMLGRLAEVHALCSALEAGGERAAGHLVGEHRTRYDEIGSIELVGAAAWPWSTPSGYDGLTVLFWEPFAERWSSWSESRPRSNAVGFTPQARFEQDGPWSGANSPRQVARSTFRLMSARRNAAHRLSASTASRVLVTGPSRIRELGPTPLDDWSAVRARLAASIATGLAEANPLDAVLAIRPARWDTRSFDQVAQRFTWMLVDTAGQTLTLEVLFDEHAAAAIQRLEQLDAGRLNEAIVIGRVQQTTRGISFYPFTLHLKDGAIMHVHLDDMPAKHASANASHQVVEESADIEDSGEADEETPVSQPVGSALAQLLDDVDDTLLVFAESGVSSVRHAHVERLRRTASRCARAGLATLGAALDQAAAHTDGATILRCAYLARLHHRAAQHEGAGAL